MITNIVTTSPVYHYSSCLIDMIQIDAMAFITTSHQWLDVTKLYIAKGCSSSQLSKPYRSYLVKRRTFNSHHPRIVVADY